ncbi:MAG: NHL repeat-containing protein [Planctomycetota bacterium]|jgi:hypothetical protein
MRFFEPEARTAKTGFGKLMVLVVVAVAFGLSPLEYVPGLDSSTNQAYAAKAIKGDMDRDGDIDLDDLQLFSRKWLGEDWDEVDWCQWVQENPDMDKHLGGLHDFIMEYFQCGQPPEPNEPPPDPNDPNEPPPVDDPLALKNSNVHPTRLAWGPFGHLYVSDPTAGSVFIYDPNLSLVGELKGLDKPLGIAVDQQGNMYVGNNGSDNVEVYDFNGVKIATIGQGRIRMANDLALDRSGNLYVADSLSNVVWVYDANGVALNNIGNGALEFPVAVTIAYRDDGTGREVGELYVAEQANFLVNVYDLQGNLLRFYGGQVRQGMMGWKWQGLFANIQSLAVDRYGRLHVADCYMNKVQILNADTGSYIGYYGEAGGAPGQLNLPLDIAINSLDQVAVTNFGNKRVEIIYTVP